MRTALLLAVALSTTCVVDAQTSSTGSSTHLAVNGCGTGWNTWLVPDSIPVLQCTFEQACNGHDVCYGKCEGKVRDTSAPECEYLRCREGGDLVGTSRCNGSDLTMAALLGSAQQRRLGCDNRLSLSIRTQNQGKPVCQAFGLVYRFAVRQWADGAFRGIDESGKYLEQTRADYDGAIREFFKSGSEDEFRRFVASIDETKPLVNLSEPIKYEKGRGLVNVSKKQ